MKLNCLGVVFKYHGDEITRYWPWVKKRLQSTYHSSLLYRDFNSFKEYWKIVGEDTQITKVSTSSDKMIGFSFRETLAHWSAKMFPNEHLVILIEPDPRRKGPAFWSRLSPTQRIHMMNDVVVLRCKDETEMNSLLWSIDPQFSDAMAILNGDVINSNDECWDWSIHPHRKTRSWK